MASGSFRVINVSNSTIYGSVSHETDATALFENGLEPGGVTKYHSFSPSLVIDTWYYKFKSAASGGAGFRGSKNCNFVSKEDKTMDIVISGSHILIIPSSSSPCSSQLSPAGST